MNSDILFYHISLKTHTHTPLMTYYHDFMTYHYGNTVCYHLEERGLPASLFFYEIRTIFLGIDPWSAFRQECTDNTVKLLPSLSREPGDTFCGRQETRRRSTSKPLHRLYQWFGWRQNYLFAQQSWQSIFMGRTKKLKIFTAFSFTWRGFEEI